MVEETIRSIRETENQADEIVRTAEERSLAILEEAKKQAEQTAAELTGRAKAEALASAERAKEEGGRAEEASAEEIEKDIRALKDLALVREKEAVNLVISLLA